MMSCMLPWRLKGFPPLAVQVSVNGTLATTAADVGGVLATMATSTADTNGILATAAADVCGFLAMPTAVGLLALGGHRGQLLAATLEVS